MDPFDNPRHPAEPDNKTEIREAQESDSESPIEDARREKIEGLKKAVADGTYTVSAEEVARKLIEQMLEPKE
jgi:anti-sigma28 factor (negative regulator of flagellin synthesis)